MQLKVVTMTNQGLAPTNCVLISANEEELKGVDHISLQGTIFKVLTQTSGVEPGEIALNTIQRRAVSVSPSMSYDVTPYVVPKQRFSLENLTMEINTLAKSSAVREVNCEEIGKKVIERYSGMCFTMGQSWVVDYAGSMWILKAMDMGAIDEAATQESDEGIKTVEVMKGMFMESTRPLFRVEKGSPIKLTNMPASNAGRGASMFKNNSLDLEKIGIGGLDGQFATLFRRAFASRIFPPSFVKKLGISHVKGILLYGPPGTGKTLIARKIAQLLNGAEPKKVDGPSVMSKFVGESEANIRALFEDAEAEQAEKGDDSQLHTIIFDEIDAICKERGSTRDGTGVHDSLVNQLLAKIDGVDSLNNILLIGMTNRKDMIDEALLRPGRFEVQIKIGLPDEHGRVQIFKIHTENMKKQGVMAEDVNLEELAHMAKNYSGAEIEGVVKTANSYAFSRMLDLNDLKKATHTDKMKVDMADFTRALNESTPAYGVKEEEMDKFSPYGILDYGERWAKLQKHMYGYINFLKASTSTSLMSILLDGPTGVGKTSICTTIAVSSGFPFVRMVRGAQLVGYQPSQKVNKIRKAFDDAAKSPFSVIILDGLEELVEWNDIGSQFSNPVAQVIMTMVKEPVKDSKSLVLATTSRRDIMEQMGLAKCFAHKVSVQSLQSTAEIERVVELSGVKVIPEQDRKAVCEQFPTPIPIKTVMEIVDVASAEVKNEKESPADEGPEGAAQGSASGGQEVTLEAIKRAIEMGWGE